MRSKIALPTSVAQLPLNKSALTGCVALALCCAQPATAQDFDADCVGPYFMAGAMVNFCGYPLSAPPECAVQFVALEGTDPQKFEELGGQLETWLFDYADARGFHLGDADDMCPAAELEISDTTPVGLMLVEQSKHS